ncbi:MAG TPA: ABC transporter substrate-binding protein [Actinomycetota bacterium]|nr:ABC transporter substrate-binding protein [Actinomycetota bacterium]
MRNIRRFVLGAFPLALAMVLGACGTGGGEQPGGQAEPKGTLTVGVSAAFAENQIVAEMYAQVLENAGYTVNRQMDIASREVSQPALESGRIDLKPEYLGTLLLFLDPDAEASGDPAAEAEQLKPLLGQKGLTLLDFSQANDTNAFVVTQQTAAQYSLSKMSDLKANAGNLTLGGPPECPKRPFCIPGVKKVYGATFGKFEPIGACDSATAEALDAGRIDVALLCSTQSIIVEKGWVVLEDDKDLQQADNIAPVIRTEVVNQEITDLLNGVSAKLTTENIIQLNKRVEIDKEDPADVARDFLEQNGLL